MVNAGNTFPVTENPRNSKSLKGQACHTGYQSHFTIVDSANVTAAFPTSVPINPASTADELVVFDHAQAVPLFVFYVK